MKVGLDLIEIERIRAALDRYPRFRERCFTEAERAYCDSRANPAQHYAARFAGKEAVGKALGFGVARAFRLEGRRDRRPAEAVRAALRPGRGLVGARGRRGDRPLDDALEGHGGRGGRRRALRMTYEPLYTAEEMRAAEAAHPGPTLELMERAGARRSPTRCLARFPDARRVAVWCGTGANGGDGLVVATELLRAGREPVRPPARRRRRRSPATRRSCSGGRTRRACRSWPSTARPTSPSTPSSARASPESRGRTPSEAIGELNAGSVPVVSVDLPSGVDASTGRVAGAAVGRRSR